jgi:DNA-binding MarR family transcriptional regulator
MMRSNAARADPEAPWLPPATTSVAELLNEGSDADFRGFLHNLMRASAQLLRIREALAALGGMTSPRYAILMQVAHKQGDSGISVRAVAEAMNVTAPFVVTEVGHLIAAGLVEKRKNPLDKRGVLLSLTEQGRTTLERLAPTQRMINDAVFGSLSRKDFNALSKICAMLVRDAEAAAKLLEAMQSPL